MDALIMPMTLLVILIIFGIVFLVVNKKRESRLSTTSTSTSTSTKSSSSKNNTQNSGSNSDIKKEDVFKFMEFDRILDDMIVQNNGSRFTMAVKCKGINYDLMSDMEQLAVEEGFITFLNTLRFPIQLYVQAQNVDLKSAIAKYKENVSGIKSEYEKLDYQYTKTIEAFDSTTDEIEKIEKQRNEVLNVYEYASDIINYVERMSYNKSLLQRNFYVLISYNTSEVSAGDRFSKEELIRICYNELLTRCQNVIGGLSSCSVEGKVLDSNELADLLFTAYNRDDKSLLNVREAIESGFYRLYSTSEDAFIKKRKMLIEEIQNESKIRALVALKDAIEKDEYISPKVETIVNQEDISRKASELIAREPGVPADIKKKAQERIVNDYRNIKKTLLEEVEQEKREIVEQAKVAEASLPKKEVVEETNASQINEEASNTSNNNSINNNNNYSENVAINNAQYITQNEPINNAVNNVSNDTIVSNNYETKKDINETSSDLYEQSVYEQPTNVEKINPSEVVRNRMVEDNNMNNNRYDNSENDRLIFNDDRLGGESTTDSEEDEIII